MKSLILLLPLCSAASLPAQETPAAKAVPGSAVPGFTVLLNHSKTIVREEAAPLAGMSPVRKPVTLTRLLIERPPLPELPEPLPPADINDPAVASRLAAMRGKFPRTEITYVSATVHDHRATFVRWWPGGRLEDEMNAWVNIDFNLFCGTHIYQWKDRRFALLMGIGNESAATRKRLASRLGKAIAAPAIPAFPDAVPGYVLTKGVAENSALDSLTSLLDLYRAEEPRLSAAYAEREAARIAREAELRRNPPQPQDVTTWIGEPKRMDLPVPPAGNR